MFLITSGDYVNQELEIEFGKIPPAFLPLQNKRLFHHQIDLIPDGEIIYLSIPETYVLNSKDGIDLERKLIRLISIPLGLSLGESIVYSLNIIGNYEESLKIVHGDTLLGTFDYSDDVFVYGKALDNYKWDYIKSKPKKNFVYSGFFSFSDQKLLIKELLKSNYDFSKAIFNYQKSIKVNEVYTPNWYDLGHINTFYRSKSVWTTEREFNRLVINNQCVIKESLDNSKILAEANWFKSLPIGLKIFTPQLYNFGKIRNKGFYEIEYLFLSSLSDLFVFGSNNQFVWGTILKKCQKFINLCYHHRSSGNFGVDNVGDLYASKTLDRLHKFSEKSKFDLNRGLIFNGKKMPSILEIYDIAAKLIKPVGNDDITIMHGDFCFSNILFDFKTQNIKVIDPRGLINGDFTIYGDIRYDVAKLAHSIIGLYDYIIADYYILNENSPYDYEFEILSNLNTTMVQDIFAKMKFASRSLKELDTLPIIVLLFLSMLPLHSDNVRRQKALMLNALRVFNLIER